MSRIKYRKQHCTQQNAQNDLRLFGECAKVSIGDIQLCAPERQWRTRVFPERTE